MLEHCAPNLAMAKAKARSDRVGLGAGLSEGDAWGACVSGELILEAGGSVLKPDAKNELLCERSSSVFGKRLTWADDDA